jgi:hypothetical protein
MNKSTPITTIDALPGKRCATALELLRKLRSYQRPRGYCGPMLLMIDTPWGVAADDLRDCGFVTTTEPKLNEADGYTYFEVTLRGGKS